MNGIAEVCQAAQDTEHFRSYLSPECSFIGKHFLPINQSNKSTIILQH